MLVLEKTMHSGEIRIIGSNPLWSTIQFIGFVIFATLAILINLWRDNDITGILILSMIAVVANAILTFRPFFDMRNNEIITINQLEILYKSKEPVISYLKLNGAELEFRKIHIEEDKQKIVVNTGIEIKINEENTLKVDEYTFTFNPSIDTTIFFQPVPKKIELHLI